MVNVTYYPKPENITDISSVMQYINSDLTGGFFGITLLIIVWMISYISFKEQRDTLISIASANFISSVFAYLLVLLGILSVSISLMMTVLFIVSIAMIYFRGETR